MYKVFLTHFQIILGCTSGKSDCIYFKIYEFYKERNVSNTKLNVNRIIIDIIIIKNNYVSIIICNLIDLCIILWK